MKTMRIPLLSVLLAALAHTALANDSLEAAPSAEPTTKEQPAANAEPAPKVEPAAKVAPAAIAAGSPADPWEKFNRAMFRLNDGADRLLLKPLAKGYTRVTPAFFRQGVSNVLANIEEVPSTLNGILQGDLGGAAHDTGRFLVNSTLGLAGILDVAQYMNLKSDGAEDFGQTLAVWGVGSGPYLVLPFMGPSTLRDTTAMPVDWYTDPTTYIDHIATKNTVKATSLVSTRADLLPLEKSLSGDKYVFIREVYLQRRNFLVNNGVVEDSFGEDIED